MNIACLQTFLTVVLTGNLNKAAERLNVTQSTVTARMDTLEQALGQRLLLRSRRGTELTKAGFAFQRHAELMVQTWDLGRKRVGLPKGFSGLFSFACHDELWDGLGENLLDNILDERPDLAVEAWPGEPSQIRRWLASGLVDVALVTEPVAGTGIVSASMGSDRLVQISNVQRSAVSWDPDYSFVDLGAEFRRAHVLTWPVEDTARISFAASRWALNHLLARGGSAYLPWRLARSHVESGRLFIIEGSPEFERPIHFAWRETAVDLYPWIESLSAKLGNALMSGDHRT